MQQANNLISQSVKSIESAQQLANAQGSEKKTYRVNSELLTLDEILWKRFGGLYGYTFTRQYGAAPSHEWIMAIDDLAPNDIKRGLEKMVAEGEHTKFPPNPLEFRKLCLAGEDLGIPEESEALQQAVGNRTKKHPAVIYTLQNHIDPHKLRRLAEDKSERSWSKAWALTVDHVRGGGELPEPVEEVEHKPEKAAVEVGGNCFAGLKTILGAA